MISTARLSLIRGVVSFVLAHRHTCMIALGNQFNTKNSLRSIRWKAAPIAVAVRSGGATDAWIFLSDGNRRLCLGLKFPAFRPIGHTRRTDRSLYVANTEPSFPGSRGFADDCDRRRAAPVPERRRLQRAPVPVYGSVRQEEKCHLAISAHTRRCREIALSDIRTQRCARVASAPC